MVVWWIAAVATHGGARIVRLVAPDEWGCWRKVEEHLRMLERKGGGVVGETQVRKETRKMVMRIMRSRGESMG